MEKVPQSPKTPEAKSERILTGEEVLEALSQYAPEGYVPGRELSNENGVYLREVEVTGENGDVTEYQYKRKGRHGNRNESSQTEINVVYYENGIPVGGDRIAVMDEETGEWKKL